MSVTLTWPAGLEQPERNSWTESRIDPRTRRAAEAGVPRWRRRFSAVPRTLSMSLVCTRAQKGIFDRFFEQETRHGAHLFWMSDAATDGWALLDEGFTQMLDEAGVPLLDSVMLLCSFGDELPRTTVVEQVKFRISFSLVVLPT